MEQQVNLYQPILGAEQRLFSAATIAIGLLVLIVCLGALSVFAAWRTVRIEHSVAGVEQQQATQLLLAANAGTLLHPAQTLAQSDAVAREISESIAARERALQIVRRGTPAPASGFAARLEALAQRQIDGIWVTHILLSSGASRMAMEGATTDARLLPAYLAALSAEHALDDVRFDRLVMRRAGAEEAPAQIVFDLAAPGLKFDTHEAQP